jgi:hypothetical protein
MIIQWSTDTKVESRESLIIQWPKDTKVETREWLTIQCSKDNKGEIRRRNQRMNDNTMVKRYQRGN